jgi:starch synthase (maltosyl-transferring)
MEPKQGTRRVVIEGVSPEVDCGRFPSKRTVGDRVHVEADIFADGHEELGAVIRYRREDQAEWTETPLRELGNDRWQGHFDVPDLARYRYTVEAWVDRFATWYRDLGKRLEAEQDVSVELVIGADLAEHAAGSASGRDAATLRRWARRLRSDSEKQSPPPGVDPYPKLAALMAAHPDRTNAVTYGRELRLVVDRERARFSTWYELFPRSTGEGGRHGTFGDVEKRLAYVAELGFDVVYLPPIHPIGRSFRKGRNNSVARSRRDPGSPWAIGAREGGHTSIHPKLGTMEDFERMVETAGQLGMEVALDLAYQCSADHPYIQQHPEWFRHRPDGTIQYAENPPKKYQDIYPMDFGTGAWRELWEELKSIVDFWIDHGVRIFRVDNPHTKPFQFWEWMLGDVKARHPDVLFLSEAFTRPKVMHRLAKLGFDQSYTYFTWRNTKQELIEYFGRDLPAVRDFFRPNLWPNTPDILTEQLQAGGRPAFVTRLILAATLGASYGIYGPAFELCEHVPLAPGKEEYLNSEKYEIREWDLHRETSLAPLIAKVNRIRRDNGALQRDEGLRFHRVDNDQLVAYSKATEDGSNVILVVVNLDPKWVHSGFVTLPLADLGIDPVRTFEVHDLLSGSRFPWRGPVNYVELDPKTLPAHVFAVEGSNQERARERPKGGRR